MATTPEREAVRAAVLRATEDLPAGGARPPELGVHQRPLRGDRVPTPAGVRRRAIAA